MFKTIEWKDGKVIMIDQLKLPLEVKYNEYNDYLSVAEAIKTMIIRGAPAIGIAASMGIAIGARDVKANNYKELMQGLEVVFSALLSTRPTAVNIKWAVNRFKAFLKANKEKPVDELKSMMVEESIRVLHEDIEINRAIGQWGSKFVKDGMRILTHCNAGALATGGIGTATAPMLASKEQGKKIHVYADETRPFLQGARLTSWELMQAGIPVTLITDNTAGALMKNGEIDMVIVGTDRTVRNGDVANKIGTYSVAVLAKENKIPFYVAAPTSSIDLTIKSGDMIPIEERSAEEVTNIFGRVRIAPEGVDVRHLAFDVTPAKYVTAIITELGAFKPKDLKHLGKKGFKPEDYRL